MAQLELGGIWAATAAAVRRDRDILVAVAGALVFLPRLLLNRVISDSTLDQLLAPDRAAQTLALLAPFLILWVFAQVVIIALFLGGRHGGGISVGEALRLSLALLVPAVIASFAQGVAVSFGLMLLVLPGFYLMARLALVVPTLVTRTRDPFEALRHSWQLTTGNGLRIALVLMLLFSAMLLIGMVLGGLAAAFGFITPAATGAASNWGVGRWIFEAAGAVVSTAISIYYLGFIALLYRHLEPSGHAHLRF